jgi:hypothetical protein
MGKWVEMPEARPGVPTERIVAIERPKIKLSVPRPSAERPPAELPAPPAKKPPKKPFDIEFKRYVGRKGEIISPHVGRTYKDLLSLVTGRERQLRQYFSVAEIPPGASDEWRTFNSGVGEAEGRARAYAARGRGEQRHEGWGENIAERKLWLVNALVMHEVAANCAAKRDALR